MSGPPEKGPYDPGRIHERVERRGETPPGPLDDAEGLPPGARLSVIGPTLTPGRRFAACVMDSPTEYSSRTLSWGFGESMAEARADALRNLATYDPQTWPYRNENIDRAVERAGETPPGPDIECLCGDVLMTVRAFHGHLHLSHPETDHPSRTTGAPGGVHIHGPEEGPGIECREYLIGSCRLAVGETPPGPLDAPEREAAVAATIRDALRADRTLTVDALMVREALARCGLALTPASPSEEKP